MQGPCIRSRVYVFPLGPPANTFVTWRRPIGPPTICVFRRQPNGPPTICVIWRRPIGPPANPYVTTTYVNPFDRQPTSMSSQPIYVTPDHQPFYKWPGGGPLGRQSPCMYMERPPTTRLELLLFSHGCQVSVAFRLGGGTGFAPALGCSLGLLLA